MLKDKAKKITLKILDKFFKISNLRVSGKTLIPYDMEQEFIDVYRKCSPYTMTAIERLYSLYKSVEYITKYKIPGDIVECGVWRGGSMMLCAITLLKLKDTERTLYLYDTYEGMTEPTEKDIRIRDNILANNIYSELKNKKIFCSPLSDVKNAMYSTGYPKEKLKFIVGKVEDTIPSNMPEKISLLRLDTDWFESTYHELKHLFPKLTVNGVIIIDDYGYWKGAKQATDNYLKENKVKILLNRIDHSARIGIKVM